MTYVDTIGFIHIYTILNSQAWLHIPAITKSYPCRLQRMVSKCQWAIATQSVQKTTSTRTSRRSWMMMQTWTISGLQSLEPCSTKSTPRSQWTNGAKFFGRPGINLQIKIPNPSTVQVTIGEEAPAVVTPAKPKYYLLGTVSLEPNSAVKLKWWAFW